MRTVGLVVLLAATVSAGPAYTEAEILERWDGAGPDERRRMGRELLRFREARRFGDARPILVRVGDRTYTLAALFQEVLDPALRTPLEPRNAGDLGLQELHRLALASLVQLREAYAPPAAVHPGTLSLMLDYAHDALTAVELSPLGRLRFFVEAVRNVRALEGRVQPDANARWLLERDVLPALLGTARRLARTKEAQDPIADAASLLYLPSMLSERAQRLLAPYAKGGESRRILLRAYRQGRLDATGMVALARSVAARTRDDAAYAAGVSPLILELLCDPRVSARERGELFDAAFAQLAPMQAYAQTVSDLGAAAFGGPPRPLRELTPAQGPIARPVGERAFRFLQVLLVAARRGEPQLAVARVVRADAPLYRPLYHAQVGGDRGFVGVLAPAPGGEQADFLGPPPGVAGARDLRLLRRGLRGERISIRTFGAAGEYIELCAALPEDASEPVPTEGARLSDVLELVRARVERTAEESELIDLIRFLVRADTVAARELAVKHARGAALAALLPLAEQQYAPAVRRLLAGVEGLLPVERERALAAALRAGREHREALRALCRSPRVGVAALAGDALMAAGDVEGVRLLLKHENIYARAAGTSLALRLTPMAGSLRITPDGKDVAAQVEDVADLCRKAFSKQDGESWARYGAWLADALRNPDRVRARRGEFRSIPAGQRQLSPAEFAEHCLAILRDEKYKQSWAAIPPYLLAPIQPGRGMREETLNRVLDAIEARLGDETLRAAWRDALVVLACVQHGIEVDPQFGKLAQERLARLAGDTAPTEAVRKGGVYWPIWAAGKTP